MKKNNKKKIKNMVLLAGLVFSFLFFGIAVQAQSTPSLTLGTGQGNQGDSVSLSLSLADAPTDESSGITIIMFDISYDANAFEMVTDNNNPANNTPSIVGSYDLYLAGKSAGASNISSGVTRVLISGQTNSIIQDMELATLTFRIKNTSSGGNKILEISNVQVVNKDSVLIDTVFSNSQIEVVLLPRSIHRFWSNSKQGHFFTVSEAEKDFIIANDSSWTYEGVAYEAFSADTEGVTPVYRFWSQQKQHHFFTVSQAEKEFIEANDPSWAYEGISYYAYATEQANTTPVYRFWSNSKQGHFFTVSQSEKEFIEANDPSWSYEGIAWYVPE